MNNGESDLLDEGFHSWEDQRLESGNASPASTDYSSYGESEFEKYCSANSVMGTASRCSSVGTCNDFLDSDFGSLKNLRFDDDRIGRTLPDGSVVSEDKGMLSKMGNQSKSLSGDGGPRNSKLASAIDSPQSWGDILNLGSDSQSLPGSSNAPSKMGVREEDYTVQDQSVMDRIRRLIPESNDLFEGSENGSVEGEERTSSKCEHSDDEESMFGDGTDDEQRERIELYHKKNIQFRQVPKMENENPLMMNSAMAFGADDWNDFEQENEESSLVSTMWNTPQEPKKSFSESKIKVSSSASGAFGGASVSAGSEQEENVRDRSLASSQVHGTNVSLEDPKCSSINNRLVNNDLLMLKTPVDINLNTIDIAVERELQGGNTEDVASLDETGITELQPLDNSVVHLNPIPDKLCSSATEGLRRKEGYFEDRKLSAFPLMVEDNHNISVERKGKDSPMSSKVANVHLAPIKVENHGSDDLFDELVLDMEEVLLDSRESPGARFVQGNKVSVLQLPHPFRDGSSTASTSGTDGVYPVTQPPLKIDGIEVVGAKQKNGDVSLGERLVGVKEYTVYKIRVWSGADQWEVERRYRDFYTLYRHLKRLFAAQGWSLPYPWSHVEQESRKIFGNSSPGVVSERSSLIQECLRSVLHSSYISNTPSSLICFLSPQKEVSSSSMFNAMFSSSISESGEGTCTENISNLGKTISLIVKIQPPKSIKQLLEAQHYTCSGCHKQFNAGKTLMREFVETLGWGKPRLCDYTGQLFCASCHTNDTAVLPAKVLHLWDFTECPVSQFAKSYLESIYDQPMLCVSAVNPFLFSKVPTLLHVMGIRKKIGAMLPYLRCPFRRSVNKGLGSRRYLLESNDFFALRDLVDLSKGAFAVLPVKLETVSMKILEHITQQCLVCCDAGVPCGARQACEDTSSLIFPFQEGEVDRCASCDLVFHKPCFRKLTGCLCGGTSSEEVNNAFSTAQLKWKPKTEVDGSLELSTRRPNTETPVGFLSSLFSRSKRDNNRGSKNNSHVILMGSLPSNSL